MLLKLSQELRSIWNTLNEPIYSQNFSCVCGRGKSSRWPIFWVSPFFLIHPVVDQFVYSGGVGPEKASLIRGYVGGGTVDRLSLILWISLSITNSVRCGSEAYQPIEGRIEAMRWIGDERMHLLSIKPIINNTDSLDSLFFRFRGVVSCSFEPTTTLPSRLESRPLLIPTPFASLWQWLVYLNVNSMRVSYTEWIGVNGEWFCSLFSCEEANWIRLKFFGLLLVGYLLRGCGSGTCTTINNYIIIDTDDQSNEQVRTSIITR